MCEQARTADEIEDEDENDEIVELDEEEDEDEIPSAQRGNVVVDWEGKVS